jgi:hypothetical protein
LERRNASSGTAARAQWNNYGGQQLIEHFKITITGDFEGS